MPTIDATQELEPAGGGGLREAALEYAGRGLQVIPLHSPGEHGCSCGRTDCASPGKHPRTMNGLRDASTDSATVLEWWARWPTANVGIVTGAASGIVALDADVPKGAAGTLARLEKQHGKLPKVPQVLTGSGGAHYYFAYPGHTVKNSAGTLGSGLDVRGDGGYLVAPPSVHACGRVYQWVRAFDRAQLVQAPAWLLEDAARRVNGAAPPVEGVIPQGRRRQELLSVAGGLRRRGLTAGEIVPTLVAVNKTRCRPPLELRELEALAGDVAARYLPDPEGALATEQESEPVPLSSVVRTFELWMHLPDAGALYAVLATVAANRVEELDPCWLLVVGPSGGGKSETLAAIGGLGDVHQAATLTEASLLSGTAAREKASGAKGGLLREVGDFGVLVLKDFGSVLSMHRDARGAVLAALREVYDGSWTRHVGTDGGRTLSWSGKLGLVAGATPAIDQHHSVLSQLGERFVTYRLNVGDAADQARRSLDHHGRERGMRQALREAVSGLFAAIDFSATPPLEPRDGERLVALTTLVARARSPVVRDSYQREIELVPDSEAPGRLVGALARLLTGLRLIGVPELEAWRVTVKAGLDSMPAARRRALELLVERSGTPLSTTDAAAELGLPSNTTRRVLEDLTAHGVVNREPQGPGKADLWRIDPWAERQFHYATTVPEMSGDPLYTYPNHTFDDFSGTVGPGAGAAA